MENPREGRAWWAAVYGVAQSRTRLKQLSNSSKDRELKLYKLSSVRNGFYSKARIKVNLTSNGEKAMAPHSSTLAWKIPWTEEPGRLQSMGSLRVRHD